MKHNVCATIEKLFVGLDAQLVCSLENVPRCAQAPMTSELAAVVVSVVAVVSVVELPVFPTRHTSGMILVPLYSTRTPPILAVTPA